MISDALIAIITVIAVAAFFVGYRCGKSDEQQAEVRRSMVPRRGAERNGRAD